MTTATFRKNQKVTINKSACFTVDQGGQQKWPIGNYLHNENGLVEAFTRMTAQDKAEWQQSARGKRVDCGGEWVTMPEVYPTTVHKDEVFTVINGRLKGGEALIKRENGQEVTIKREHLIAC